MKKLKIKNKNQEIQPQKARSMVEMLGVLAIVGVLSIGAIAGYSTAMEKQKINKLINDINNIVGKAQAFSLQSRRGDYTWGHDMLVSTTILPDSFQQRSLGSNYTSYSVKGWRELDIYVHVQPDKLFGQTCENSVAIEIHGADTKTCTILYKTFRDRAKGFKNYLESNYQDSDSACISTYNNMAPYNITFYF